MQDRPSSFLPADRRAELLGAVPVRERTAGVALFADVVGFTATTQRLVRQRGPRRGVEAVVGLLNRLFGELVPQVHTHGGSVVMISGDALTCWFDDALAGDALRRALACAARCQRIVTDLSVFADTPVALKVALARGPALRLAVGDPDVQQIEVVAGATLVQVALAESVCRPDEIVAPAALVGSLPDQAAVVETRTADGLDFVVLALNGAPENSASPWPVTSASDLAELDARAAPWLLPGLTDRILAGRGDFLAELRPTAALFVRFSGIDFDGDPDAGRHLDAFVRWIQACFTKHGGSLLQVIVGEKGSFLYGTFGAPVAHEDDAARAVAAGRLVVGPRPDHVCSIDEVRAGLARGPLLCGPLGAPSRRVFTAAGAHANLAARLMQSAAPGELWCDATSAEQAGGRFRFTSLPPVTAKGFDTPVAVFRAEAPLETASFTRAAPATLEGRTEELRRILDQLAKVAAGRPAPLVFVEGEAGIGKSALLDALREHAERQQVAVLSGRGVAVEAGAPYHGWRRVFRKLPRDPDDARIGVVLGQSAPEDETTTPEIRADRVRQRLLEVLEEQTRAGPTLVVLEDGHWLDSASVTLARRATRRGLPLLVVVSSRPPDATAAPELEELRTSSSTLHVRLGPLDDEAFDAAVARRLEIEQLPARLAVLIRERAQGNPLYGQQLAMAAREAGWLRIDGAKGRLAPGVSPGEIQLPDTLFAVVGERLDRLDANLRLGLKVASVIGTSFSRAVLGVLWPDGPDVLDEALEELVREGLLERLDPRGTYRFDHAITRDAAYGSMTFAKRRELHAKLAEHLETDADTSLPVPVAVLAHHWQRAEVTDKARSYLEAAGENALANNAHGEAARFYEALHELDAEGPDRARYAYKLGLAYRGWGHFQTSRQWLETALPQFGEPLPRGRVALASRLLAEVGVQTAHYLFPSLFLGAGGRRRDTLLDVGEMLARLSELAFFDNRPVFSLYAAVRSLNAHERAGDSAGLAAAYSVMGLLSGMIGFKAISETYYRRGADLADQLQLRWLQADVARLDSVYRLTVGQWARAREAVGFARTIAESLHDDRHLGDCLCMQLHADVFTGDHATGAARATELRELADRSGMVVHELWGLTWGGAAELRLGNLDEAEALLSAAEDRFADESQVDAELCCIGYRAQLRLQRGDRAGALDEVGRGLRRIDAEAAAPSAYPVHDAYGAFADVLLTAWERDPSASAELRPLALRVIGLLHAQRRTSPIASPAAWQHQGRLELLDGRPRRARRAWQRGRRAAKRLAMPHRLAGADLPGAPIERARLEAR